MSGLPRLPSAPKYLSSTARRLWRETVESYELDGFHVELLERACRALDTVIEAEVIRLASYTLVRSGWLLLREA